MYYILDVTCPTLTISSWHPFEWFPYSASLFSGISMAACGLKKIQKYKKKKLFVMSNLHFAVYSTWQKLNIKLALMILYCSNNFAVCYCNSHWNGLDLFTDTTASLGAKLRVILQESDIRRLDLPLGIPATVGELEAVVRETFGITGNFVLHYKDVDFGEEYFSLNSTGELKDRDTIKVHIVEPPTVTLTFTDLDSSFGSASQMHNPSSSAHTEVGSSSSCSGALP